MLDYQIKMYRVSAYDDNEFSEFLTRPACHVWCVVITGLTLVTLLSPQHRYPPAHYT